MTNCSPELNLVHCTQILTVLRKVACEKWNKTNRLHKNNLREQTSMSLGQII